MFLKMLLCGAAVALPYVLPNLWFLSYVTLIPVIFLVTENFGEMSKRKAYFSGFGFGLGYYIVVYHWFIHFYAMKDSEGIETIAAVALVAVCWFGLATLQALEFGAVTLFYRIINPRKEKNLLCAVTFTALWVLFEWQQGFFWRGVPFARLALTQANSPLSLQSASVFGNLFVSGLIVFVNALLCIAVKFALQGLEEFDVRAIPKALKNKKTAIFASVALAIFTLNLGFGAVRVLTAQQTSERSVKTAVVQANISSLEKWSGFYDSLDSYVELTRKCVNDTKAEIVVWPETVLPDEISGYESIMNTLKGVAKELDITLLVGSFDEKRNESGEREEYNAIYLFYPDGSVSEDRYYKQKLVPFGEYNPIGDLLALVPALDVLGVFNDSLTPGDGSQLLESEHGTLGSLICFDSIYDYVVRASVNDGAQLITLSTNDSWFADSSAVYMHNRHAMLRAIENGRWVVRSASTGISSVISPTGEIVTEIAPLTEGYTVATVYMLDARTVYSYVGDIFAYLCLGFILVSVSYKITVKIKNKKEKSR